MSTKQQDSFEAIAPDQLEEVAGGATRVSGKSSSNDQLQLMLTQIGDSIKDLAASKNNSGGDTMQLMLMMLMMGGLGGGGGGAIAAAPATTPPVINVSTGVAGGGCRRGKKGW